MHKKTTALLLPLFFIASITAMDDNNNFASPMPYLPLWSKRSVAKIGCAGAAGAGAGGLGWYKTLENMGINSDEDPGFLWKSTLLVSFSSGVFCSWMAYNRTPNAAYHQATRVCNRCSDFNMEQDNQQEAIQKLENKHLVDYPLPLMHKSLESDKTVVRNAAFALKQAKKNPDVTEHLNNESEILLEKLNNRKKNIEVCKSTIANREDYQTQITQRLLNTQENAQKSYAKKTLFATLTAVAKDVIINLLANWLGKDKPSETVPE